MELLGTLGEIAARYLQQVGAGWPWMVLGAALGGALLAARARLPRVTGPALLAVATVAGAAFVFQQLALVDDAFISFRYAHNWLDGQGLVWNPGERVEGVTNLAWTVLLGVAARWVPLPIEHLSLLACAGSWLACVGLVAAISKHLHDPATGPWLPLGAALVAVQSTMTAFGSTGLETGFASALGLLGGFLLLRSRGPTAAYLASLVLILATMVRLDQALLWIAAGSWVAGRHGRGALRGGVADRQVLLSFAVGWLPMGAFLAWKLWYYGNILPNTYYAKAAGAPYLDQGAIYLVSFWLGSHGWLLVLPLLVWVRAARGEERALAAFVVGLSLVWHAYVWKVGGDFMYGRFLVTVLPWLWLGAERGVLLLAGQDRRGGIAAAVLLGATLRGVPMIQPRETEWYLADENTIYPVARVWPLEIDHHHFRTGHLFRELFADRGIRFPIATSGIGMVGFYSGMEIIDMVGLTDPVVAHQPLRRRGRPGHEKAPPPGYLDQRGVRVTRLAPEVRFPVLQRFDLPGDFPGAKGAWFVSVWDDELMQQIEQTGVQTTPFEPWLVETFLPKLAGRPREQALSDLRALDRYYWDLNGHDALRERVVQLIELRTTP